MSSVDEAGIPVGMSKKKPLRSGFQTTIRLADLEYEEFDRAAKFEGFSSIASWMLDQAKWRAEMVNSAMTTGEWVEVRGRKILLSDLPLELRKKGQSEADEAKKP